MVEMPIMTVSIALQFFHQYVEHILPDYSYDMRVIVNEQTPEWLIILSRDHPVNIYGEIPQQSTIPMNIFLAGEIPDYYFQQLNFLFFGDTTQELTSTLLTRSELLHHNPQIFLSTPVPTNPHSTTPRTEVTSVQGDSDRSE